jgi:hypothetical protein
LSASNERRQPRGRLSIHDEELLAVKNRGRPVRVVLACQTYYTDEDGNFTAMLEKVDTYAIRFRLPGDNRSIWVLKQAIVSTHESDD